MTPRDERWTRALTAELVATLLALVGTLAVFTRFVNAVEARPGIVLRDPVLARLTPHNLTWIIFGVMYACIPVAVVSLVPHPRSLILGLRAYVIMVFLRMAVMAVVPFDPPASMIPLQDPMVQGLGTGRLLTRDLFFSGHTATLSLMALTARGRRTCAFFIVCTVVLAFCLVWQAVHYTVDVLAAPVFTYAAYRIAVAATSELAE